MPVMRPPTQAYIARGGPFRQNKSRAATCTCRLPYPFSVLVMIPKLAELIFPLGFVKCGEFVKL